MLDILNHMLVELGPGAAWLAALLALVVIVLVFYLGVALRATLRAQDPQKQQLCYQLFRDLLELFKPRPQR